MILKRDLKRAASSRKAFLEALDCLRVYNVGRIWFNVCWKAGDE